MKKLFVVLTLIVSCFVSSAQNKTFPKGEVLVSAGRSFFFNTSIGWSASAEYSVYSFSRFSVGVGLVGSGFSYQVENNGNGYLPRRDLIICPDVSLHMDIVANWELYLKAGFGVMHRVTEETTGNLVKNGAMFDTAIGTRINIFKGLGVYAQVGLPVSAVGLCFAF